MLNDLLFGEMGAPALLQTQARMCREHHNVFLVLVLGLVAVCPTAGSCPSRSRCLLVIAVVATKMTTRNIGGPLDEYS